jgi:RIO kinase 2
VEASGFSRKMAKDLEGYMAEHGVTGDGTAEGGSGAQGDNDEDSGAEESGEDEQDAESPQEQHG